MREAPHLVRVVGGVVERLGEQADRADRRLQLVADVGDEVAAHRVEPERLGAVLGEQQDVARAEPRDPHAQVDARVAERPARRARDSSVIGLAGPAHAVDELDEVRMHERPFHTRPSAVRAGRRLDHVVRRVEHDARRLQRVEHLVDAVRHRRADHLDRVIAAARGDVQEPDETGADGEAECQRQQHQPGGVHERQE